MKKEEELFGEKTGTKNSPATVPLKGYFLSNVCHLKNNEENRISKLWHESLMVLYPTVKHLVIRVEYVYIVNKFSAKNCRMLEVRGPLLVLALSLHLTSPVKTPKCKPTSFRGCFKMSSSMGTMSCDLIIKFDIT